MDTERRWEKKIEKFNSQKKVRREAPANSLRYVRFLYGRVDKLKIGHN